MGTKLAPGSFDCYAAALADEPMFILLARDPQAPATVEFWANTRNQAALREYRMTEAEGNKVNEAMQCAKAMRAWRAENEGRWREPAPAINGSAGGTDRLVEVAPYGVATVECEGRLEQLYLYNGVRMATLGPDPRDLTREVISILGGTWGLPDDRGAEGVAFTMSQAGLSALAADLLYAADRVHARTVFYIRQVL